MLISNVLGSARGLSGAESSTRRWLLHPGPFCRRRSLGFRQQHADRVPSKGAVHGYAGPMADTCCKPKSPRVRNLRMPRIQDTHKSR